MGLKEILEYKANEESINRENAVLALDLLKDNDEPIMKEIANYLACIYNTKIGLYAYLALSLKQDEEEILIFLKSHTLSHNTFVKAFENRELLPNEILFLIKYWNRLNCEEMRKIADECEKGRCILFSLLDFLKEEKAKVLTLQK